MDVASVAALAHQQLRALLTDDVLLMANENVTDGHALLHLLLHLTGIV
jgi:hypothetical protein